MHQPIPAVRHTLMAASAVLLSCAVHAQTTLPAPMPERAATSTTPERAAAPSTSGDQNTPAPIARQQQAEIARGDPARWHQEDTTTAAQMRTMRKDIAAGLQENLGACKKMPAAERSACMNEARATYRQEMSNLGRGR